LHDAEPVALPASPVAAPGGEKPQLAHNANNHARVTRTF
jgi:hypothetical protein